MISEVDVRGLSPSARSTPHNIGSRRALTVQTETVWIAGIANGFIGGKATRASSLGRRALSPGFVTSKDTQLNTNKGEG
jgi:hypothetical protein